MSLEYTFHLKNILLFILGSQSLFMSSPLQTGHSALQRAAAEGHLEVVKHLVGRGAAVDHQDEVVSNRSL